MGTLTNFLRAWKGLKAFKKLPARERKITFYAENNHSMVHFERMLVHLTQEHDQTVCYLSSSVDDPIFSSTNPKIHAFYVGEGTIRTVLFIGLEVDLLVLTMPDLETFQLKRSKSTDVHYLYVFHAMVSTHSNYRKAAFDHYDTIFLTGPDQHDEIRSTESIYDLPSKTLVEVGYPRLDALRHDFEEWRKNRTPPGEGTALRVIVAPSWGETAVLETCGKVLVQVLLDAGYFVTVRPHPMTTRKSPKVLEELESAYGHHERFAMETDVRDKETLYASDVMISDWSGVAMEYAFGCDKPVIYIDVPKKNNNPESRRIPHTPIEVSVRERIGRIVHPDQLDRIPEAIERIYADQDLFLEEIEAVRQAHVYNLDRSASVGARYIVEFANKLSEKKSTPHTITAMQ